MVGLWVYRLGLSLTMSEIGGASKVRKEWKRNEGVRWMVRRRIRWNAGMSKQGAEMQN